MFSKEKPTELKDIKIYEGLYRASRMKNITSDVMFFLETKRFSKSGILKDPYKFLIDNTDYSKSSIYTKISRLVELGLVSKGKTKKGMKFIEFISYKKLYTLLELDLYKENKKGRVSLPIYKIKSFSLNGEKKGVNLKNLIFQEEIRRNLKRQEFNVLNKAIDRKIIGSSCGAIQKGSNLYKKLKKQIMKRLDLNLEFHKQLHALKTNNEVYQNINYDITLSCERLSLLFGYNSKSSGLNIEYKLKEDKLINLINNRYIYLDSNINNYNLYFKYSYNIKGIYIKNNKLYKQLPNKIEII